jgi:hypothetical protein
MADYPVMFTVRDTVSGSGFLAGVTLTGRAIMTQEDGKWWVLGVRPAPIVESGEMPQEAFLRFRNSYKNVLFDFAESSEKYETSVKLSKPSTIKRNEKRKIVGAKPSALSVLVT